MAQHTFPFRDLLSCTTPRLTLKWRQHVRHKRLHPPNRTRCGTAQKLWTDIDIDRDIVTDAPLCYVDVHDS